MFNFFDISHDFSKFKRRYVTVIKKRLGVFVEKSTFPGIQKQDEVVEINNVPVDILDETAFQHQISELSFTE